MTNYTKNGDEVVDVIKAPTNRNGLRNSMIKIADKPFEGAQAHHILPWKYNDWLASKRIDINLPQFGAWVRGDGNGGHQT